MFVPSESAFSWQMSRVLKSIAQGDRKEAMASLTEDIVPALRLDAMMSCYLATVYAMLDDQKEVGRNLAQHRMTNCPS
jgi:hypothetical protein